MGKVNRIAGLLLRGFGAVPGQFEDETKAIILFAISTTLKSCHTAFVLFNIHQNV